MNEEDRRRLMIELTELGRAGVEEVDQELAERLSPSGLAALRSGLAALAAIKG